MQIEKVLEVEVGQPIVEKQLSAAELAIAALRLYTKNNDAKFRDSFQERWVRLNFERRHDLLVVARTGSGKSLAYTLPPLVELTGVTVIVQPLRALVAETAAELRKNGVSHVVYNDNVDIEDYHRVVVTTTNMAGTGGLFQKLKKVKRVNRVIIDEAHCYRDDLEFRSYATGVSRLRKLDAPFLFMTATLLQNHDQELFDLFAIQHVHQEREVTARPELQLNKYHHVCME